MEAVMDVESMVGRCQVIHGKNLLEGLLTEQRIPALSMKIFSTLEGSTQPILHSSTSERTTCPSWTMYGFCATDALKSHFKSQNITVRVESNTSSSSKVIFEEVFDLSQLYVVETSNRSLYPAPFLCFQFNGVRCTSQRLATSFLKLLNQSPQKLQRFVLDSDDDVVHEKDAKSTHPSDRPDLHALLERHQALQSTQQTTLTLQEELRRRRRVQQDEGQSLAADSLSCEEGQRRVASTDRLRAIVARTETCVRDLASLQALYEQKKRLHVKLKFLVETRRERLLRDLFVIYPIVQNAKTGEFSIRGFELPYDLNMVKDDDQLASALGYVVHVLLMASKYLEVPLRYQLLYHGSRCLVRDLVASTTIYPLFRSYNDKERFEKGVLWLRADVEQILGSKGLYYDPMRSLLANLSQIISCDICPALTF